MSAHIPMPRSAWLFPMLAVAFFLLATGIDWEFSRSLAGLAYAAIVLVILFGTVFAAVHHADIIAVRVGEPYGTLVLTMAVTIIEVAVIATIMLGENEVPTLARDTVFAVVMIVCNGLVGICIMSGGFRYREQDIQATGASVYLSVLIVLATITLVLPNYTLTTPGPFYSTVQLAFVSCATIILYGVFLYIQTIRHRDYFIGRNDDEEMHAISNRMLWSSVALLLLALVGVVILAKKFSVVIDAAAAEIGAPPAFAGIVVALLILLPESVAAIGAARRDQLQRSINLALGSSLATIGLTIPAVSVAVIVLGKQLVLGLSPREMVLLAMTILISMLTLGTGRTNILFGLVHVVVFAVFLFTAFVP
jgi:Ca2+:H+ antiporter